jgi:hypothetical protein
MTNAQISSIHSRLWGPGISSCNRLELMLEEVDALPSELFWRVFREVWPTCDNTWEHRDALLDLLRFHQPNEFQIDAGSRAFYEGLPDVIDAYRGCSRSRLYGLSWSTDRAVAASFANGHRAIPVPDPIVAHITIAKPAILAVFTDRGESEILVDTDEATYWQPRCP